MENEMWNSLDTFFYWIAGEKGNFVNNNKYGSQPAYNVRNEFVSWGR